MADGSVNSSERTVSDAAVTSAASPAVASMSIAHHYVSLKLTNNNFLFWRTQVVPFLRGHELLGFVDGSNPCPPATLPAVAVVPPASNPTAGESSAIPPAQPNPLHATWVRQDQAVLSMLISSLSPEVMHLAVGCPTSQALWQSLEQALASSTRAHTLHLLSQFQTIQQGDSSIADYIARAQVLVEDLALAGRPVPLDEQNLYVCRGLRPEFIPLTASLAVRGQPVSLQELASLLGTQSFMAGGSYAGVAAAGPAAFVTQRGGGRRSWRRGGQQQRGGQQPRGGSSGGQSRSADATGQFRGGQRGSSGGGGRSRGRGGRGGSWQPRCQICGLLGHTALACYSYVGSQPQAHMVYNDNTAHIPPDSHLWVPDTGATHHATPDIAALSASEDYHGDDTLRVGDGKGLIISRIGHATVSTPSRVFKMSDILHVPGLSSSLLSVQRFATDNHVFFEFHPSYFVVKDITTKDILLRGSSSGGLYTLPVPGSRPQAFLSSRASSSVWHDRLGHPHQRVLRSILPFCPVSSSSHHNNCTSALCSACQLGKSSRFPLPRTVSTSSNILDLIYTDIWGPAPVYSFSGHRYFCSVCR